MPANQQKWMLYLIRCNDKTLYCGVTTDVRRRFKEHQSGGIKAARYLRGRSPLTLAFHTAAGNRSQALKLEYRVKKLTRARKEKLISGKLQLQSLLNDD
ncbi:GIY-YIG nuclease family protein [Sansalvadorimonas sp. 2012CJ34-2]|uniref:GIY-YIG nuclease family protein n=1 Tax=Parendozoicomonas callyspongiae TaxID=2942213 RepID=A0ABT0PBE6_9GAMM|nr:GIY-YIG nuclease family protein [Sansalvadorimonas sp. 2012CJ34-2]MCL6268707.1 GIY-YIG nuclease family protein [Sansalvadorimonas sp. 2012CJ34-2]